MLSFTRTETLPDKICLDEQQGREEIENIITHMEVVRLYFYYLGVSSFEGIPEIKYVCRASLWTNQRKYFIEVYTSPAAFRFFLPEYIFQMLVTTNNTTLKKMGFSGIDDTISLSGHAMSRLLRENHTVEEIDLDDIRFTNNDVEAMADALSASRSLQTLQVKNDVLSRASVRMLKRAVLRNPYLSLQCVVVNAPRIPEHLSQSMERMSWVKNRPPSERMAYAQYNCLRFYSLTLNELDIQLMHFSMKGLLTSATHVFVYNTPMNNAFKSKWFNDEGIGPSLQCLTLAKCGANDPNDYLGGYFMDPENSWKFPALKLLYIAP